MKLPRSFFRTLPDAVLLIGGWDDKEWLNSAMRYMGVST